MHESSNFKTKTVSGIPWTPGCKYASRPPLYQNMKYFTFCQEEEENKQISMGATYTRHFEYVYKMCKSLSFFLPFSLRRRHSPWRAHVTRVTDTRRPPHATSSRLHLSHLLSLLSMPSSCSIVLGYGVAITKSQLIPPLWSLLIGGKLQLGDKGCNQDVELLSK